MMVDEDRMGERFKLFALFPPVLKEHLARFPVSGFVDSWKVSWIGFVKLLLKITSLSQNATRLLHVICIIQLWPTNCTAQIVSEKLNFVDCTFRGICWRNHHHVHCIKCWSLVSSRWIHKLSEKQVQVCGLTESAIMRCHVCVCASRIIGPIRFWEDRYTKYVPHVWYRCVNTFPILNEPTPFFL